MNHKRTIIALAVIMIALLPMGVMLSDESDAGISMSDSGIWGERFTNTGDGTLFVTLKSTEDTVQTLNVKVTESGNVLYEGTVAVPADTTYVAELVFRLNGLGDHVLTVTCTPEYLFPMFPGSDPPAFANYGTVTVTVTESVWSKPTTYIALIVVAVLVVIAVYMYMRNAPTVKPDTTFTELERQQRERGSAERRDEAPKASATERRRYRGSSGEQPAEKSKPSPPPEEKKAKTFTELEKEKSEKKTSAPKKEAEPRKEEPKKEAPKKDKSSSSDEPKKLKYVSSRRK